MKKIMTFLSVLMMVTLTTFGQDNWFTIMSENFQNFPTQNNWVTTYNIIDSWHPENTIPTYWGKSNYSHQPNGNSWSGWCAGDGSFPIPPENGASGVDSWMIYGPFNLTESNISNVQLDFWYAWNAYPQTCSNSYFKIRFTTDTTTFNPPYSTQDTIINLSYTNTTGNPNDPLVWVHKTIDIPYLIGQSGLFIGIQFYDPGNPGNGGGWIDDIVLRKDINVGVDENKNSINVNIYPNPSNGTFTVENMKPNKPLVITDMSGKTIYECITTSNKMNFNLNVPSGIYIIKNESIIRKVFVTK